MKEKDLKEVLQRTYAFDHWTALFKLLFKKVELFHKPESLFEDNDSVIAGQQSGLIKLDDGKALAIFEVEVNDSINIVRNRQGLREIAAKYIDQNITHGALVFFHNKKQKDYRFSFIAKWSSLDFETGELVKGETKPKRFTYILGPNEACTTAAKRLLVLMGKRERGEVGINELRDAFSVEALNKEFFKSYKFHYERFWTYIAESEHSRLLVDESKEEIEDQQKPIRDFVKKLLGRVVFLHFLQKKGWMGCPKGSCTWEGGEPRFMQRLFDEYEQKEHFYSKCLSRLFFETLNTKRSGDAFHINGLKGKLNGSRVPYLNGGLFDPEKNQALATIDFPPDFFQELLDFFEQYNFTIDENSPDDHEVGIDPEMLGHIFENLLEENREKGAFYTPKEIVQYMCKESLIEYLGNTFSEKQAVEAFIRFHRVSDYFSQRDNAKLLDEKLSSIKVCDPAIGSGAFPIGMLQEIFEARRFIYPYLKTNAQFDPAKVKKSIIRNSIYGVDFEKGAVDIAQLRFWLALVVEEVNPHPLPNLDYKIMQGNSLLEKYEGIDLGKVAMFEEPNVHIVNPQINMYTNQVEDPQMGYGFSKESRASIKELINSYFKVEDKAEKVRIHKAIDRMVIDHIDKSLEGFENRLLIEIATYEKKLNDKLENLASEGQKQKYRTTSKEAKEIAKREKQLEQKSQARQNLLKFEETDERPYFLWHLYFMNVFEQGGFDVMIGNPPYIQLQKIKEEADILADAGFDTFTRTGDIYCLFYEKGVEYIKEKGVLSYITSNSWMRAKYGKALRHFFEEHTNPLRLLNFENTLIFKSATVETNILVLKKSPFKKHLKAVAVLDDLSRSSLHEYLSANHIVLDDLPLDGWSVSSKEDFVLKRQIEEFGTPLMDWKVNISYGIKTGLNDAFMINGEKASQLQKEDASSSVLIKKFIGGRDISRYKVDWNDTFLIATLPSLNLEINEYPSIRDHLKLYKPKIKQTGETYINQEGQKERTRKKTSNKWFETQDQIAYWEDFEKPKLIWAELSDLPKFVYDEEGYYTNKTTFIMTGEKLKFLAGILNSKVLVWYFDQISTSTGMGTTMWSKYKVEQIPVKIPDPATERKFEIMVDYILYTKKQDEDIFKSISNETVARQFEEVVDQMAYELYFEEHMKEQKIDVLKFIHFPDINEAKSDDDKKALIQKVYYELTEKDSEMRNRILLSFTRSPGIIKRINDAVIQ